MPFWSRRSLEFSPTLISFPAFPPESAPYLRGSCRCLFYLVCSLPGKLNPTQGLANHPMLSTTHRYPPPAPLQGPHVATTAHFRLDILAGTSHHLAPCKCRLPKGTFLLQQTAPACTVILSGSWEPTLILPSFLQAISKSSVSLKSPPSRSQPSWFPPCPPGPCHCHNAGCPSLSAASPSTSCSPHSTHPPGVYTESPIVWQPQGLKTCRGLPCAIATKSSISISRTGCWSENPRASKL